MVHAFSLPYMGFSYFCRGVFKSIMRRPRCGFVYYHHPWVCLICFIGRSRGFLSLLGALHLLDLIILHIEKKEQKAVTTSRVLTTFLHFGTEGWAELTLCHRMMVRDTRAKPLARARTDRHLCFTKMVRFERTSRDLSAVITTARGGSYMQHLSRVSLAQQPPRLDLYTSSAAKSALSSPLFPSTTS